MKKILLFTSILVLSLSFVKAQSIDAVLITSPILCFGDFADIEVGITQTSPSTALNYVVEFSNTGSFYFQIAIAPLPPSTTFGTVQPFPNLASGYYRIKIKDAALIVLDSYDIYIPQPDPLSAIATQLDSILCNGNCTAKDSIAISGPTQHLDTLTEIKTELLELINVSENITTEVNLNISNDTSISYSQDNIKLRISVKEFTQKTLLVPVVVNNLPLDLSIKLVPENVTIRFDVPMDNYNKIIANNFIIICDFDKKNNQEDFMIPHLMKQPASIINLEIQENKIDYLIFK